MTRTRDAVDVQVHVDGSPGFAPVDGQVDVADVEQSAPRQQSVSVVAVVALDCRAGDGLQAQGVREVLHLDRVGAGAGAGVDLLQPDDVGVDSAQNLGDPFRIAAPVAPHALVDVVRDDAQPSWGLGHPPPAASP